MEHYEKMLENPLMATDYYNLSHWYLKKSQDWEVSHIYNRTRGMILYGFNELVINWFEGFQATEKMVNEAEFFAKQINPESDFPRAMWLRVVDEFEGRVPILVEAVPDGTYVPKGAPFAQIRNTAKDFGEMVTWFEAILLKGFFASGCATRAFWISKYLQKHKLPANRVHSFGFRGYNSLEDAYWGSRAFSMFLGGSDDFITKHWEPDARIGSIAAEAHKVISQFDTELDAYTYGIDSAKVHGQSILAIVIDTYDAWRFIEKHLVPVAQYAKSKGLFLVIRPDSGNSADQVIAIWNQKVKHGLDNIACITGEGMTFYKMRENDQTYETTGIPLDFVSIGLGAGFYKDIDRDYLGWSMKTAYSNGAPRMKFANDPIKQSIPGVVDLLYDESGEMYVESRKNLNPTWERPKDSLYKTIWAYHADQHMIESTPTTFSYISALAHTQTGKQLNIKLSRTIQTEIRRIRQLMG